MEFAAHTDSLMKPFLNSFGKCTKTKLNTNDNKNYKNILISLYQDIYDANETIFAEGCFKHQVINLNEKNEKNEKRVPELTNSRYFPSHIQNYIKENETKQLVFSCGNVGGREITIIFTLFVHQEAFANKYIEHAKMMYIWLTICAKYASAHCTNTLTIFVYPTPFAKILPGSPTTTMGPEHVNTAFTFACAPQGQLLIYREEEWFKVFIHETFHSYGLDFAQSDTSDVKKSLFSLFPIKSDFDVYEAYTETWARLINCAFCSFNALPPKNRGDKQSFITNFNFCIELERMFAMYQCVKVLGFMGLQYQDLHSNKRTALYKENTHVFAYYVITAVFLNDYQGFILWCRKNNTALLKFDLTPANFKAFTDYIAQVYNCISLQSGIVAMGQLHRHVNKGKNKTLIETTRMSIIHTI